MDGTRRRKYHFLNICKQRLPDQFIQGWFGDMETGSDIELYGHVEVRFCYNLNFDVVTIPKYRYTMCKFFTQNHRLAIVSGRWLGCSRERKGYVHTVRSCEKR